MNLKRVLIGLAIALGVALVVAVVATMVVLIAAGIGALLSGFLPFSMFEATLLALIAAIGALLLIGQIILAIARFPISPSPDDEDEFLDEMEEIGWEDDDWEDDDELGFVPPGGARQEPIRRSDFEKVGRNDPCPCGSGRKYKNCHGRPERLN